MKVEVEAIVAKGAEGEVSLGSFMDLLSSDTMLGIRTRIRRKEELRERCEVEDELYCKR